MKKSFLPQSRWLVTIILLLSLGVSHMWGAKYNSVGTTLTDGKSYILVAGGKYAITAKSSTSNWIDGTDVSKSISESVLTTTATDIVWVAKKYTDGSGNVTWSFKNGSSYIQNNSGTSYRNMTYGGTESKYTIKSSKIYSTGNTGKWLQFVTTGFRMYNSKQSGASETFVFYEEAPTCTAPTAPTKDSFFWDTPFSPHNSLSNKLLQ